VYYLHVGASLLPRQPRGEPMTLAEALYRAYGLQHAVVYRLGVDSRPVPVVGDAGNPDEVVLLPGGRRVGREEMGWPGELGEAKPGAKLAERAPGTGHAHVRR